MNVWRRAAGALPECGEGGSQRCYWLPNGCCTLVEARGRAGCCSCSTISLAQLGSAQVLTLCAQAAARSAVPSAGAALLYASGWECALPLLPLTYHFSSSGACLQLEWVEGEIWANVWLTECIARIDPATGRVK